MTSTHAQASSPHPANAALGQGVVKSALDEQNVFSLRDTLSGISVREANFGEFLAALRQRGMHAAKA